MRPPPEALKLPETLQGPWKHALILTYGLDVPFFENALLRQFGSTCTNKIILADGDHFESANRSLARSGLARHLNQHYVAGGIFISHAAHAKMILLASEDGGRLLVGSGNLGMQGFASGGELFLQYDYDATQPAGDGNDSTPFVVAWHFVNSLIERGYVPSRQVDRQIRLLFDSCPWFLGGQDSVESSLRHNLDHPFIEQLGSVVDGESVEELWVLSPFYDREVKALERLVRTFEPADVILMVQRQQTSLDSAALARVFSTGTNRLQIMACNRRTTDLRSPYLHAKMVLLRTATRDICLQGSPNMSQVAMTLAAPLGNIELANLLNLPRNSIDPVLEGIDRVAFDGSLSDLGIEYHEDDPEAALPDVVEGALVRIVDAEWKRDRLVFLVRGGEIPSGRLTLVIGETEFEAPAHQVRLDEVEITLTPVMVEVLAAVKPASLQFTEGEDVVTLGPIFPVNRTALESTLQSGGEHESLGRVGQLDLDDEEIERMVGELEAALIIDERSLWQVARSTGSVAATEDAPEASRLRFEDIDWDQLRQHPRLRQYALAGSGLTSERRSQLQIILASILGRVNELIDVDEQFQKVEKAVRDYDEESEQAESEEEREEEEVARQPLSRSAQRRIRDTLVRFIKRYLNGIENPSFQRAAGVEVLANNYVIFSHLLWRLMSKDWVEQEFLIEATLRNWRWFWGEGKVPGLYRSLDDDSHGAVDALLDEHKSVAQILTVLVAAARMSSEHLSDRHRSYLEPEYRSGWERRTLAVRDYARDLVPRFPARFEPEMLTGIWRDLDQFTPYEAIRPSYVPSTLEKLLAYQTGSSLLEAIEAYFGLGPGTCSFGRSKVAIPGRGTQSVDILIIPGQSALAAFDDALYALSEWLRSDRRGYYRLQNPDPVNPAYAHRTVTYDAERDSGMYLNRDDARAGVRDFGAAALPGRPWDANLDALRAVAHEVDARHMLIRSAVAGVSQPR